MALGHKDSQRPGRRAFQPTLDGRLETRTLMSATAIRSQTAAGGQAIVVTNTNGQQFYISVTEGTIRGIPAPGGRVSLIAAGTKSTTLLEINQIIPMHSPKRGAHNFNNTASNQTGLINIASITVTTGTIGAIEGYHTAILSGPISIGSTNPVNRIALQAIKPGGSIGVGGDLNTLDVAGDATFSGSTGLFVGRDLNWFETNGNLTLDKGANLIVARGAGQIFQVAKGSGNAGQGIYVNGNLSIGATSNLAIGTNAGPYGFLINGNLTGAARFTIGGVPVASIPVNPSTGFPFGLVVRGSAAL